MGLGDRREGEVEEGGDHWSPQLAAERHGEAHGPDDPPDFLGVRPALDQCCDLLQIWYRSPIRGIVATEIEMKKGKKKERRKLGFRALGFLR